jgi:hypothetical protein
VLQSQSSTSENDVDVDEAMTFSNRSRDVKASTGSRDTDAAAAATAADAGDSGTVPSNGDDDVLKLSNLNSWNLVLSTDGCLYQKKKTPCDIAVEAGNRQKFCRTVTTSHWHRGRRFHWHRGSISFCSSR